MQSVNLDFGFWLLRCGFHNILIFHILLSKLSNDIYKKYSRSFPTTWIYLKAPLLSHHDSYWRCTLEDSYNYQCSLLVIPWLEPIHNQYNIGIIDGWFSHYIPLYAIMSHSMPPHDASSNPLMGGGGPSNRCTTTKIQVLDHCSLKPMVTWGSPMTYPLVN